MLTLLSIQDFLDKASRGELDVSPASLEEFEKDCREAAAKQLKREKREWYVRIKSRPSFRPLLSDRTAGLSPVSHYADLDF